MNRMLTALIVVLSIGLEGFILWACTGKCIYPNCAAPERAAATRWLTEQAGGDGAKVKIDFERFRCIDSTTLTDEISRRRELQETKAAKELSFRDDYRRRGLRTNAARKDSSIAHCRAVIAGLDSIAFARAAQADSVLFREYEVIGTAATRYDVKRFDPIFLCIAPDGTVVSSSGNLPDIHKATGKAIPGYMELLDGLKARGI